MNANWIFEDGYLAASNDGGRLLRRWTADEAMGQGLAHPITHKFFLFLKQRVRQKFRDGKRLPSSFCTCQKYVKTAQSA